MLLLAIDTSGPAVTVALHDGAVVLAERSVHEERKHAELLVPSIAAVLDRAGAAGRDVTELAVGIGPGPFTGLRAGLVTARVLGLAWQVPVHGVCSLDALAGQALRAGLVGDRFVVATDARRREVYWAAYLVRDGGHEGGPVAERTEGPEVAAPDRVPRAGVPVAGRGAALYPQSLGLPGPGPGEFGLAGAGLAGLAVTGAGVAALAVHRIRSGLPDDGIEPLYLRRPDAAAPGPRKRVLR